MTSWKRGSQQSTTGTYPEPNVSSPQHPKYFSEIIIIIIIITFLQGIGQRPVPVQKFNF
jgi:hypothetical protein